MGLPKFRHVWTSEHGAINQGKNITKQVCISVCVEFPIDCVLVACNVSHKVVRYLDLPGTTFVQKCITQDLYLRRLTFNRETYCSLSIYFRSSRRMCEQLVVELYRYIFRQSGSFRE